MIGSRQFLGAKEGLLPALFALPRDRRCFDFALANEMHDDPLLTLMSRDSANSPASAAVRELLDRLV